MITSIQYSFVMVACANQFILSSMNVVVLHSRINKFEIHKTTALPFTSNLFIYYKRHTHTHCNEQDHTTKISTTTPSTSTSTSPPPHSHLILNQFIKFMTTKTIFICISLCLYSNCKNSNLRMSVCVRRIALWLASFRSWPFQLKTNFKTKNETNARQSDPLQIHTHEYIYCTYTHSLRYTDIYRYNQCEPQMKKKPPTKMLHPKSTVRRINSSHITKTSNAKLGYWQK